MRTVQATGQWIKQIVIVRLILHNSAMPRLILFIFLLTLLAACGPGPEVVREIRAGQEQDARALLRAGDYAGAAAAYLQLAEQDPPRAAVWRLEAAAAYVAAALFSEARALLAVAGREDARQDLYHRVLTARLELEAGRAGDALASLNEIAETAVPASLGKIYHESLARAGFATGAYRDAARQRLKLQAYLTLPAEIRQNTRRLWAIFTAFPPDELNALRLAAVDEAFLSWLELAALDHAHRFRPDALGAWRARYPGHPAASLILPELLAEAARLAARPARFGLLLPFSGPYRRASAAIRDGFLAAWYLASGEQAEIEIYDSDALNIVERYRQAARDGVDFVIGPLEKEAVNALLAEADLPVRILALNRGDDGQSEAGRAGRLIQFGLWPEDEARQVAEAAFADGHGLALALTPATPWGRRVAAAFEARWGELGGTVLEQVEFESNSLDYGAAVKALLNVDGSEQRARALRLQMNRRLHHVERRRQDADFIFAAAPAADAYQLLPQLRFHRAADLPVYATSHIFSGAADNPRDADLEGALFIDMPWLLDSRRQASVIQAALNRNWAQDKSAYRRLYALGIDAYHLGAQPGRLRPGNAAFNGATGDLTLTPDHHIKRQLRRARFAGGKPVMLEAANSAEPPLPPAPLLSAPGPR